MTATTIDIGRRVARWGFWFFLLKGLAWLIAPLAAWHVVG